MPHRNRKTTRLQTYDYSTQGAYYITLCTHKRKRIFSTIKHDEAYPTKWGKSVLDVWYTLPDRYPVVLDEIVVMPDHVHSVLFIDGHDPNRVPEKEFTAPHWERRPMLLFKIIGYWKANVTKAVRAQGYVGEVWQGRYWDRIVRDEAELNRIRFYIQQNPARWGMKKAVGG